MSAGERRYLSFLLRLWRARQDGFDVWRASLEDTRTGEQQGFASLETLMEFMRQKTEGLEIMDNDPFTRK